MNLTEQNPIETLEQEFAQKVRSLSELKEASNNIVPFARKTTESPVDIEATIKAASEASKPSFSGTMNELRMLVESTTELNVPKIKMDFFLNQTPIESVQRQLDTLVEKANGTRTKNDEIMIVACKEYLAEQPKENVEKRGSKVTQFFGKFFK